MDKRHRSSIGVIAGGLALLGGLVSAPAAAGETQAEGVRWTPAPGQAFNDGWRPYASGATFKPCQKVQWHFDRSGEAPERSTLIDDIRTGLATLEPHTGLTFQEVTDPGIADLTFRWGDLAAEGYDGAAGIGGPRGLGKGAVAFDTKANWTLNDWSGRDWRRLEWPRPDLGPGWYSWKEGPGREALVVHEAMHAMGFDHVEDFTSIMYPQGGIPNNRGQLSAGDIAGLNTMYLNNPCTVTSTASPTAASPTLSDSVSLRIVNNTKRKGFGRPTAVFNGNQVDIRMKTKLKPGSNYTVHVLGPVMSAQEGTNACWKRPDGSCEWRTYVNDKSLRVNSQGGIRFKVKVESGSEIQLRDFNDKTFARFYVP